MGKMMVIRRNVGNAAAWCKRHAFYHRMVGNELRIYGLASKPDWLKRFHAETGAA